MDMTVMLWGLLFGSIGLGYFMYGKKIANPVIRYTGLALMFYPYVVQDSIAIVIVGIGLIALPKFVRL